MDLKLWLPRPGLSGMVALALVIVGCTSFAPAAEPGPGRQVIGRVSATPKDLQVVAVHFFSDLGPLGINAGATLGSDGTILLPSNPSNLPQTENSGSSWKRPWSIP